MDGLVLGHWFGTRQRRSPSVDTRMAVELCPGGHSNDTVANGGASALKRGSRLGLRCL